MIENRLWKVLSSLAVSLLVIILVSGCTHVSPQTVKLSVELTERTKDLEQVHLAAINQYFDTESQRIEEFLEETWIPLFLKNYLGESMILADLQRPASIDESTRDNIRMAVAVYLDDPEEEADDLADKLVTELNASRADEGVAVHRVLAEFIVNEKLDVAASHVRALLNTDTPARLILDFAEAANEEITLRRRSLNEPLELARQRALAEIVTAYSDLYAGQGVITGRLEALVNSSEQQAKMLDALGGDGTTAGVQEKIAKFSKKFNEAFNKVEQAIGKVKDVKGQLESDEGEEGDFLSVLRTGIEAAAETAGLN